MESVSEMVVNFVKVNAKSIVVPVVAIILAFLKWVSENAGVDIIVNNETLTNTLATILIAIAVWWTRNKARKEPVPEMLRDRGDSTYNVIWVVVGVLLIIALFMYILGRA